MDPRTLQAPRRWGRRENLVLVYLATAVWAFVFTTVLIAHPALWSVLLLGVGTLAVYLYGHRLVGGSLRAAEASADQDWIDDVREHISIPDRVKKQLLHKRQLTDD